jgi:hypothetical protein
MKGFVMLMRNGLAMVLCVGIALASLAPAQAGLIKAVKAKHKANPASLHSKVQETIKDHKAAHPHQPIRHSKRK